MNTIERILLLIEQRGITRYRLSKDVGISEGAITSWTKNVQKPSTDWVVKIAEYFKVSTDFLLGVTENPETSAAKRRGEYSKDETDLVSTYRLLTPNSKQIVQTVAEMELRHVKTVAQGETPIKMARPRRQDRGEMIKVYNQSAAAGFGNSLSDDSDDDYKMVSVPTIPVGAEFGIMISGDSMEPDIHDGEIAFVKRQTTIDIGDTGIFIYDGDAYCKILAFYDGNYYLRSANKAYGDIPLFGESIYCVGKVVGNISIEDF
ncbi:MAG: helix-turn-helix domain-containing protein [Firmicutes bacterium]|nr:helix-turn-helix domain-containing protein [Bacillota bacterium]